MSWSKTLYALPCLLCLAPFTVAEKPDAPRSLSTDNRKSGSSSDMTDEYTSEIGGKKFEDWLAELSNPDPSVRCAALIALTQFKQAARAVPRIAERLYPHPDADASCRVKAAIALLLIEHLPTDHSRAMQALAHAVSTDPQSIVRYEAVRTLKFRFCPINHKDKDEREVITKHVLSSIGSITTYELREACIDTVIAAGVDPEKGPDPSITRALLERANVTREPTDQVRLKAIMALGIMGRPQAPELWSQVQNLLKTTARYSTTRRHRIIGIWARVSQMALEEKVNQKDMDDIAKYLNDHEAAMRAQAVTAFGALQDKSHAYLGRMCQMVTGSKPEKDNNVLIALATALGHMNNNGDNVQKALIQMTKSEAKEKQGVVLAACSAMAQLRINGPTAIQAMNDAMEHPSLEEYQKKIIKAYIETAQSPPDKKPGKANAKNPEKLDKDIRRKP